MELWYCEHISVLSITSLAPESATGTDVDTQWLCVAGTWLGGSRVLVFCCLPGRLIKYLNGDVHGQQCLEMGCKYQNSARKRKSTPGSRHWVNEWLVLFYYETCELLWLLKLIIYVTGKLCSQWTLSWFGNVQFHGANSRISHLPDTSSTYMVYGFEYRWP